MRALLRHLDFQAVFVGFVTGYAVPVLFACLMVPATWVVWFWIVAPAASGYVAAKVAGKLPLMHGLAASVFGLLLFGLISAPKSPASWMFWFAINAGCSIFGAWLCRRHARRAA